jgi:TonB family protein
MLGLSMMRAAVLLLAGAALAAAPAHGQRGGPDARCGDPADRPLLPGAAERIALGAAIEDSLRLDLTAAAREAGVVAPAGLVVVQLRDHRTGAARGRTLDANLSDDLVSRVLTARAPLLARWPHDREWLHVRLDGPHPSANPREECLPAVENSAWFTRELGRILSAEQIPRYTISNARIGLTLLVSREGEVVFATLSRRGPRPSLDEAVLRAARRLRFRPASVGGVPVDVWVEQPVHF